ncbi:hypothetical protein [Streptomonospora arabica]|uniref:hypothetical protein n=1 Tax=Streptomonospora arabica TaxID=412417 RepID=UPI0031D2BA40
MAAEPPFPPSYPGGRYGPPPGGADSPFPGPPGGPLPPRVPGGPRPGPPARPAGDPGGAGAGSPPGPQQDGAAPAGPGRAAPRRAAGFDAAVSVAVVAGSAWFALRGDPPYADIAACEDLLPAGAADHVPGITGAAFNGVVVTGARIEDSDPHVVQEARCSESDEPAARFPMWVGVRRFRPATREADYAVLRRVLDRERVELAGGVEVGSTGRAADTYFFAGAADVEVRRLDAGDEGFSIAYSDAEDAPMLEAAGGGDTWAVAQFRDRNLMVQVVFHGTAAMSLGEKVEAVTGMARLVEGRAAATGRTV